MPQIYVMLQCHYSVQCYIYWLFLFHMAERGHVPRRSYSIHNKQKIGFPEFCGKPKSIGLRQLLAGRPMLFSSYRLSRPIIILLWLGRNLRARESIGRWKRAAKSKWQMNGRRQTTCCRCKCTILPEECWNIKWIKNTNPAWIPWWRDCTTLATWTMTRPMHVFFHTFSLFNIPMGWHHNWNYLHS